jgi:plasmid stability protein
MKNITLAMDEEVLRQARRYAAEHDTTVNALVREYLTQLVGFEERAAKARQELVEMAKKSKARLGPNWKWNREDAYEGRLFPRHERAPVRRSRKG